jgi:hypothetical protein
MYLLHVRSTHLFFREVYTLFSNYHLIENVPPKLSKQCQYPPQCQQKDKNSLTIFSTKQKYPYKLKERKYIRVEKN